MKVILLKDVKKQGKKNEVIDVSKGYANKLLIKQGLAVPYTTNNKNKLERELKNKEELEEAHIKECENLKKELDGKVFKFSVQSGKDGKMFGKISTKQIADALKNAGYDIDKKMIELDHVIDTLGVHKVDIILHKKVKANINIEVH